jgi:hypothetical protein
MMSIPLPSTPTVATRQSGDDDQSLLGEFPSESCRDFQRVGGCCAGTDDRDSRTRERGSIATNPQHRRRISDLPEKRRIVRIVETNGQDVRAGGGKRPRGVGSRLRGGGFRPRGASADRGDGFERDVWEFSA